MNPSIVLASFLLILLLWLISKRCHFGKVFVIKVKSSSIKILKGSPPKKFLEEVRIVSKQNKVKGLIYGVKEGGYFSIKFSPSIPEKIGQRFRNTFPFELYNPKRSTSNNYDPNKRRAK